MTSSTSQTPPPAASGAAHATPLWAVLTFTFLCSIGSAIIYGGVFFLARSRYGFGTGDNFALALLFGVTYVPAAMGAGPTQRALRRWGITPRTILGTMMVVMAGVCFLPIAVDRLSPTSTSAWPIWLAVAVYAPVSGMMWPIVESFLAGGRTDHQLRSATGRFNVCWSSAIVVTMFAMAGFVEKQPLEIIAALGVVHLFCIAIIARFDPFPAAHAPHNVCRTCGYDLHGNVSGICPECGSKIEPHHLRPVVYRQLLAFLRVMLPVSFMFNSTLSPYMPTALRELNVPLAWQTPVTAMWYFTRVLTFLAMERRHGWHGRWATPIVGSMLLLVSFAWVVLVPIFAPPSIGLWLFLAGLAAFGVGVGIIYAAALYYAMEVGSSGVDAGGTHEALIGVGYAGGPICGLAGLGAVGCGMVGEHSASVVTVGIVAAAAIAAGGGSLYKAARIARRAA